MHAYPSVNPTKDSFDYKESQTCYESDPVLRERVVEKERERERERERRGGGGGGYEVDVRLRQNQVHSALINTSSDDARSLPCQTSRQCLKDQ